jgi:hypothetical protein
MIGELQDESSGRVMKMLPFRKMFRLLVPGVLLLAACSTIEPPITRFPATADDFFQRLRWGQFQEASEHMAGDYREDFLQEFIPLKDLRITDVRLETSTFREKDQRMVTQAVLEYYLLPSITVKTFRFRQEWALQKDNPHMPGTWVVVTPFPRFP